MQKLSYIFSIFIIAILLTRCIPIVATTAIGGTAIALSKDRTVGDMIDDISISTKIKRAFIKNGFKKLYSKINVEVIQGRVLYTGTVQDHDDIINAVEIAWQQVGVREVISELLLEDEDHNFSSNTQYFKDSWITSQIKAKIFLDRSIKFSNYTIVTHNGTVHILGIARSDEELEKVANIASKVLGVNKVLSNVRIKELDHKISAQTPYKD